MLVGKVVGRLVSTNKHEKLTGNKFLVCELLKGQGAMHKMVVIDTIGAGIGETVLITKGCGARLAALDASSPVDAAIVGIIDEENDLSIYD